MAMTLESVSAWEELAVPWAVASCVVTVGCIAKLFGGELFGDELWLDGVFFTTGALATSGVGAGVDAGGGGGGGGGAFLASSSLR
jgi:hypothetical protein